MHIHLIHPSTITDQKKTFHSVIREFASSLRIPGPNLSFFTFSVSRASLCLCFMSQAKNIKKDHIQTKTKGKTIGKYSLVIIIIHQISAEKQNFV